MNSGINLNQSSSLMQTRVLWLPLCRHVLWGANHMPHLSLLSDWDLQADSMRVVTCLWTRSISMRVCHVQKVAGTTRKDEIDKLLLCV